ncbi:MAG TPA: glycosyltransferase family 2 protein [Patescibacteria group bacterium]|nr:glycosyltransferase family 2 protein [Patescibacteria group bacterium]
MNISFVIPNFNGEALLKKNLPKVLTIAKNYKNGKSEIVIADDSSKDDSIVFLKKFCDKNKSHVLITILENSTGKNKGYATNVNKGVEAAKGEIIILLNTDVLPSDNFLEPLLKHFENENVFAVGCMDESIENGKKILRGRGVGKWNKGFLIHARGDVEGGNSTLWVSGGSGAFRKSTWEKIDGLNELYNPFYWEDIDISYRAQKAGYGVLFEKKSIVRHEHETGSIKQNYTSFSVRKTAYRNQFFFTWLNATDTMLLIQNVLYLPTFLIKAVIREDKAFLFGFGEALFSLPKVLQERKNVQHLVVLSDRAVISKIN